MKAAKDILTLAATVAAALAWGYTAYLVGMAR